MAIAFLNWQVSNIGPMVTNLNGWVSIIGITSWGNGCANYPFPGVYARVTEQLDWILKNSDAGNCQN